MKKLTAPDPQTLFRKIYKAETGKEYSYGSLKQSEKHEMQKRYNFSKEGNRHVAHRKDEVNEDAVPANAAGPGAIAGIGTGPYPNSEPGVPKGKKRLRVILNKSKMLTRK